MKWTVLLALMLLVASATAAQAGHGGEVRFLADGDHGSLGDGVLDAAAPTGADGSLRTVLPTDASYETVRFLWPIGEEHPERIQGRMFAGLWIDQAPILEGQVTVTLFKVGSGAMQELASSSFAVGGATPAAPEPASLLPSDPTDPEGAAWEAVAKAYPLIRAPPHLVDFGDVDVVLGPDDRLAVGFRMADGSVAPTVALQYGAQLSPSFLFLPWHPATDAGGGAGDDPGAGDPAPGGPDAGDPGPGGPDAGDPGVGDPGAGGTPDPGAGEEPAPEKGSPGAALAILVAALVGFAALRRRS